MAGSPSMGAFTGHYAGRLGNACFALDGSSYAPSANDGPHCLHGGLKGSRFRVFDAVQTSLASIEMRCLFADGEEGFSGALALKLSYRPLDSNELVLDHAAMALDRPTVASFTSHAFFTLDGESSGSILGQAVAIFADRHFGMTPGLVATGELRPVDGTLLDLRQPVVLNRPIGDPADEPSPLSLLRKRLSGFDRCYLVNRARAGDLALCARIKAARGGRIMGVRSTEPAMQFYTGLHPAEWLPGDLGKGGKPYAQQIGLCLEPQSCPNAPNRPDFPSAVHLPGKSRGATTVYRFATEPD